MKINHILEDVVDLGKRREKNKTQAVDSAMADYMDDINVVISSTIDHLEASGMSEADADKAVMKHLSDIVMAHDIS